MDIYEYAMQMEKDGENYYRNLAEKTAHPGLKTIMIMLADAEVKHYELFQNMKKNDTFRLTDSEILSNVKNIFLKMKKEKQFDVDINQLDLYRKAQDIEKKTMDFYVEKSKEETDNYKSERFLRIANEEKRHYFILENVISFVSQPDNWLENPEWYHLAEY